MKNLVEIENDCCCICERLKHIDKSYRVFFNIKRNCFEVHSFMQFDSTYCFTIPYDELDERTLFYALKTRSENRDKIIMEIEENNKKVEEQNIKMNAEKLKELVCR